MGADVFAEVFGMVFNLTDAPTKKQLKKQAQAERKSAAMEELRRIEERKKFVVVNTPKMF